MATSVMGYPWLTTPYQRIINGYQNAGGHHVLLLSMPPGCGGEWLLNAVGEWLMCQQPGPEKACGICHSCRLMQAGHHPDWYALKPEKAKSALGIDAVRQVINHLHEHAHQGGHKVVWLPQVDSLTEAAVNGLLKTLEEPPAMTYFLLGTKKLSQLLATLRSRCQLLTLAIPDETVSLQWLSKQKLGDTLSLATALRLSGGAPIAAARLLAPAGWQQRQQLCQGVQQLLSQQDIQILIPLLSQDDGETDPLILLMTLLLDTLKQQCGAKQAISNLDQPILIQALASVMSPQQVETQLRGWNHCRHQLATTPGLNSELMVTHQLCQWCESLLPSVSYNP